MPDLVLTPEQIARNRKMVAHLKSWIHFRNLTQEHVANTMGVSRGSLSKWLSGKASMSIGQFTALAVLLDASPAELLFPPDAPETAAVYTRATGIMSSMDPQALEQWLQVGEAMAEGRPKKL